MTIVDPTLHATLTKLYVIQLRKYKLTSFVFWKAENLKKKYIYIYF